MQSSFSHANRQHNQQSYYSQPPNGFDHDMSMRSYTNMSGSQRTAMTAETTPPPPAKRACRTVTDCDSEMSNGNMYNNSTNNSTVASSLYNADAGYSNATDTNGWAANAMPAPRDPDQVLVEVRL
jgi:hypothetical protein